MWLKKVSPHETQNGCYFFFNAKRSTSWLALGCFCLCCITSCRIRWAMINRASRTSSSLCHLVVPENMRQPLVTVAEVASPRLCCICCCRTSSDGARIWQTDHAGLRGRRAYLINCFCSRCPWFYIKSGTVFMFYVCFDLLLQFMEAFIFLTSALISER